MTRGDGQDQNQGPEEAIVSCTVVRELAGDNTANIHTWLLLAGADLGLGGTTDLLCPVLPFLLLLPAGLGLSLNDTLQQDKCNFTDQN